MKSPAPLGVTQFLPDKLPITRATLQQLAAVYGVHRDTLRSWLKPHQSFIGTRYGNYYTAHQVEIIYSILGLPGVLLVTSETNETQRDREQ